MPKSKKVITKQTKKSDEINPLFKVLAAAISLGVYVALGIAIIKFIVWIIHL